MNVRLTDAELRALYDASWKGGRKAWIAAVEEIIAARVAKALAEERP